MEQINNLISIQEGLARTPYVVLERVGSGADVEKYKNVPGKRVIGEMHNIEPVGQFFTYLICEELKDAEWTDIEEPPKEAPKKRKKKVVEEPPIVGQIVDVKL